MQLIVCTRLKERSNVSSPISPEAFRSMSVTQHCEIVLPLVELIRGLKKQHINLVHESDIELILIYSKIKKKLNLMWRWIRNTEVVTGLINIYFIFDTKWLFLCSKFTLEWDNMYKNVLSEVLRCNPHHMFIFWLFVQPRMVNSLSPVFVSPF